MSFPRTYSAISAMIEKAALEVPMARDIVRKAGLRSDASVSSEAEPAILIDTTVSPHNFPLYTQWTLDLSPYSMLRLDVRHQSNLGAYFSLAGPGTDDLAPGDYAPLTGFFPALGTTLWLSASDDTGTLGDPLLWMEIPEVAKAPLRLCFVQEDAAVDEWSYLGGPTGVILQASAD